MKNRQIELMKILLGENKIYTAKHLSELLNISSKTIRNDVCYCDEYLRSFDVKICKKSGIGIWVKASEQSKLKVIDSLKRGEVIIYPTDTIYGIGCDIHKKKAIEKIYAMKNLGSKHLMSFICKDLSQAAKYVNIDNTAFAILKRILPGPYTIILEANRDVPKVLLGKRRMIRLFILK